MTDLPKCILCDSENIQESDEDPHMPFYCFDCGAWGLTAATVENPPRDQEEDWRHGQVPKRPTDE